MRLRTRISNLKKESKTILGFYLTLVLVLSFLSTTMKTAEADVSDIIIAGTAQNIDSDGSGIGWNYKAATKTLTLDNCNITTSVTQSNTRNYGIGYSGLSALTITLQGNSTIVTQLSDENLTDTIQLYGIYAPNSSVTITGKGSLTCAVSDNNNAKIQMSLGIYTGTLTINGGNVTSSGGACQKASYGIYAGGNLTINGGTVTATANTSSISYGMHCSSNGIVTIGSDATCVTAAGYSGAIDGKIKNNVIGTAWTDTAGTTGGDKIETSEKQALPATYKKVQFPATISPLGGKTQWLWGETIEFNSGSLSNETYYNQVRISDTSKMQINKGSYTVAHEKYNKEYKRYNVMFQNSGAYYLHIRPLDYESETIKEPSGIKYVSGKGTVDSPYLFELMYDETYTVTVSNDGNGTGNANPASGATGTEVTLTATPSEGYRFKEWQVDSGGVTVVDNKFTIGTENVVVKAIFELVPPEYTLVSVTGTTEGESHTWTKGKNTNDVEITVKWTGAEDTSFEHFTGVQIGGNKLTKGTDYDAHKGSTIVTLKAAMLEQLSVGAHTVSILFNDGQIDTTLTINDAASPTATPSPTVAPTATPTPASTPTPTPPHVPQTGDNDNPVLWMFLILIGVAGLAGLGVLTASRKRK